MCVKHDETVGTLEISNPPLVDSTEDRFVLTDAMKVSALVSNGVEIELDEMGETFWRAIYTSGWSTIVAT